MTRFFFVWHFKGIMYFEINLGRGYFRAFSFHTELLQIFKYENLLTSLILFSFTNAKYPAYSKLSTYQKGYYGCGYCCLVSGVFLYWLPIGLKILIVSLGEKHTQKKTFSFPTDFFFCLCKNQMKLCTWKHLVHCTLSM